MPLPAPAELSELPHIPAVAGVRIAGLAAGLKPDGSHDLFLAELVPGTTIAGTLTRSRCPGAPVEWSRALLPRGKARAIVASSGNANVFTGRQGRTLVEATAAEAARLLGCRETEIFIASTGLIGEKKPADFVAAKLPRAIAALTAEGWAEAARGIMTTDRFPKAAVRRVRIGEAEVTLAGIAKGSTMIAPDMGTMLSFLFTDAKLPAFVLQSCLARAVDRSFNCITVDGDTSTSDTVLLCATGKVAGQPRVERASDPVLRAFRDALEDMTGELARMIVRDGAKSGRMLTVDVSGAASARAARRVGRTIADSTLVRKTIEMAEPRSGRIVMAIGKAGEAADRDRLSVAVGGVAMAASGETVEGFDRESVSRHLKEDRVHIAVELGIGRGRARVWAAL